MEFCEKCGSVLIEKNNKYRCARCNSLAKKKVKIETSEKMNEREEVGEVKEKDADVFPTTTATCPKCGHNEAYFWSAQTRAADEAETQFFRCTKCKHTWRVYR